MNKSAIVIPLYNEENRFDTVYWRDNFNVLEDVVWVFVNDGSTDNTLEILKSFLMEKPSNAVLLNLDKNSGKAEAIRYGMNYILKNYNKRKILGFIDSDRAFQTREIASVIREFERKIRIDNVDALYTSRIALAGSKIERRTIRHLIGRIISTFIQRKSPITIYDTQCGFKLFQINRDLQNALIKPFATRWFFDLEITLRMIELFGRSYKICELPLEEWRDVRGSKIRKFEFIRIAREIIWIRIQIIRKIT